MREFLLELHKVSKHQKLLKSCGAQSEKAYSRQEEKNILFILGTKLYFDVNSLKRIYCIYLTSNNMSPCQLVANQEVANDETKV